MENLDLEYKEKFPKQKKDEIYNTLIKEIIAFLNTTSGLIKVGITDDGTYVGIEYNVEHIGKIMESIISNISPSARTNIDYIIKVEKGVRILDIYVNEGARKAYYNTQYGKSITGVFYRSGTSAIGLSQHEIEDLEKKSFDTTFDIKSPSQELTFRELSKRLEMEIDDIISEFELSNERLGFNYSAFLLSDQNKQEIDVFTFAGTNRSEPIYNMKIDNAPLFVQFDSIMNYLKTINHNVIIDTTSVRQEEPLFDIKIIREIIINAMVHNDYSKKDTIKIHIYSDRIQVHNFVEEKHINNPNFLKQSKVVNTSLFKCFKMLNIIEGQGIGYAKILNKYGINSFIVDKVDQSIIVVVPKNQGEITKELTEKEKILITIAKGNNTTSQLLENVSFGKTKLSKTLNEMIKEKLIIRVKNGKYTYYELVNKK